MIGLSVMVVYFFTKPHKRQPRIPIHADWNAIPIEEKNHNQGQSFFDFFKFIFGVATVALKYWLKRKNRGLTDMQGRGVWR